MLLKRTQNPPKKFSVFAHILEITVGIGKDRVILRRVVEAFCISAAEGFQIFARGHLGDFLENPVKGTGIIEPAVERNVDNAPVGLPQLFERLTDPHGVQVGDIVNAGDRLEGLGAMENVIAQKIGRLRQRDVLVIVLIDIVQKAADPGKSVRSSALAADIGDGKMPEIFAEPI